MDTVSGHSRPARSPRQRGARAALRTARSAIGRRARGIRPRGRITRTARPWIASASRCTPTSRRTPRCSSRAAATRSSSSSTAAGPGTSRAWLDGTYLGHHPANSEAAIVHLQSMRALGATHFVLPEPSRWWLDHYAELSHHLETRCRVLFRNDDICRIYSLVDRPRGAGTVEADALGELVAEFRARFDRDPMILDWDTGREIGRDLPELPVFAPPAALASARLPRSHDRHRRAGVARARTARRSRASGIRRGGDLRGRCRARAGAAYGGARPPEVTWLDARRRCLPSVSIVVPCYDGLEHTRVCLDTLAARHRRRARVRDHRRRRCLAGRHGQATSATWRASTTGCACIRNDANEGYLESVNRGAEAATGEILVFLNNDTISLPGLDVAARSGRSAVPRCRRRRRRLLYPDGRLQEAGGIVFRTDRPRSSAAFDPDAHAPLYNYVRDVDYCSGALLATPRALFERARRIRPAYAPGYYEDTDYCFAVREHGLRVYYQPASVIVHVEGGTAGLDVKRGMKRYQVLNHRRFVERWRDELARQPPTARRSPSTRPICSSSAGRDPRTGWGRDDASGRISSGSFGPPQFDRDSGSRRVMDLLELLRRASIGTSTFVSAERPAHTSATPKRLQRRGIHVVDGETQSHRGSRHHRRQFDVALAHSWPVAELLPARCCAGSRPTAESSSTRSISSSSATPVASFQSASGMGLLDEEFGRQLVGRAQHVRRRRRGPHRFGEGGERSLDDVSGDAATAVSFPTSRTFPTPTSALLTVPACSSWAAFGTCPNVTRSSTCAGRSCRGSIRSCSPQHPLSIVGDGLDDAIRRYADGLPGVRMIGWVPDVAAVPAAGEGLARPPAVRRGHEAQDDPDPDRRNPVRLDDHRNRGSRARRTASTCSSPTTATRSRLQSSGSSPTTSSGSDSPVTGASRSSRSTVGPRQLQTASRPCCPTVRDRSAEGCAPARGLREPSTSRA